MVGEDGARTTLRRFRVDVITVPRPLHTLIIVCLCQIQSYDDVDIIINGHDFDYSVRFERMSSKEKYYSSKSQLESLLRRQGEISMIVVGQFQQTGKIYNLKLNKNPLNKYNIL